jgi:gluconolactonase
MDINLPAIDPTFCPMGPFEDNPIPDELLPEAAADGGAPPGQAPVVESQTLCSDFSWAEGPVWFAETGTLYFSHFDAFASDDYYNGTIVQWQQGEGCTVFMEDAGTNGLARGLDGHIIAGRHLNRTLSHIDIETGEACSVVDSFEGNALSSPNDLAIRSDGHIYFSDPSWNLGPRPQELPESVYHLAPDGTLSLIEAFEGQQRPNGVSLSPDGTVLYVAVSRSILSYSVASDGSVAGGTEFASGESTDGMTVDCAGNLYTSGGRIYSPAGELLGRFRGGTNLAFGGPEGKTLFIVGNGELSSIELNIPGLPY